MRELIGQCQVCGREIYCENGFLNGYIDSEGKLSCFEEKHLSIHKPVSEDESMDNIGEN